MTQNSDERESFSYRLRQSLQNAHHSADSPTKLARDFNARFSGNPITVHAARKWLVGEAIPTQDKMRTLADWLMVPIEWLRFGGNPDSGALRGSSAIAADSKSEFMALCTDLQLLSEHDRELVREFVRILVRTNDRC